MTRVVTIGGGTGSFNLLTGLKQYDLDITAVVTTFDSGGSTGILRDEFGTLPAGDMRRALVALAPEGEDKFLRELFQVRFDAPESGLHNHSFGNLLLLAAERVTESRIKGVQELAKLLSIQGTVLPISLDDAHLCAEFEDGSIVKEEANIDRPLHDGSMHITRAWLEPKAILYAETRKALEEADYIIFGPGDLYTSIIANALVEGFKDAIAKSNAKLILITNIMSKWGETHDMAAHEYAKTILSLLSKEKFDAIFANTGELSEELLARYRKQHKEMVHADETSLKKVAETVHIQNFMSDADVARHNARETAAAIVNYIQS